MKQKTNNLLGYAAKNMDVISNAYVRSVHTRRNKALGITIIHMNILRIPTKRVWMVMRVYTWDLRIFIPGDVW